MLNKNIQKIILLLHLFYVIELKTQKCFLKFINYIDIYKLYGYIQLEMKYNIK